MAMNFFTGKEYQGRNAQALAGAGKYATFLQWRDGGYKVRKGARGTAIYKVVHTVKRGKDGKDKAVDGLRCYTVFELSQVEKVA